jgi:hypothetical protein
MNDIIPQCDNIRVCVAEYFTSAAPDRMPKNFSIDDVDRPSSFYRIEIESTTVTETGETTPTVLDLLFPDEERKPHHIGEDIN